MDMAKVRNAALLILLMLSPVILYLLWPSDEARIRKAIHRTFGAVEKKDVQSALENVSYNYSDNQGLSFLLVKRLLERQLEGFEDIDIQTGGIVVAVDGEAASARMGIRVLATSAMGGRGYYLGDLENPFEMDLGLKKTPTGSWQIISARYEMKGIRL